MNPIEVINALTHDDSPVDVSGIKLLPIKLGHQMALEAIGHPLAVGGRILSGDVARAAVLLSKPSEQARKLAGDKAKVEELAGLLGDTLTLAQTQALSDAIGKLIHASSATHLAPAQEGESTAQPREGSVGQSV